MKTRKRQAVDAEKQRARKLDAGEIESAVREFETAVERIAVLINQAPEFVAQRVADIALHYKNRTPCEIAQEDARFLFGLDNAKYRKHFDYHVDSYYSDNLTAFSARLSDWN